MTVAWERRGGGVTLELEVPANASALVQLPSTEPATVREGGVPATRAPGVAVLPATDGRAVLSVGSGEYRFTSN